jgi:hypothetical protein
MMMKEEILNRLSSLVARIDEKLAAYYAAKYDYVEAPELNVHMGRRYAKVVRTGAGRGESVYFFVDLTNGDLLKAATYKAPAKGARASLFDDDLGISAVGPYGAGYAGVNYDGAW